MLSEIKESTITIDLHNCGLSILLACMSEDACFADRQKWRLTNIALILEKYFNDDPICSHINIAAWSLALPIFEAYPGNLSTAAERLRILDVIQLLGSKNSIVFPSFYV